MTQNQKTVLQESNVRRSETAAQVRILKTLKEGKITRGQAVLLLSTHAGMYKYQAVSAVTEVDEG